MPRNSRTEWDLQLINWRTGRPISGDVGTYQIMTADDPSLVTIYAKEDSSSGVTSSTGTLVGGRFRFFTDNSVTSVDISILHDGRGYFLEGVTPSQHRLLVDPERTDSKLVFPIQLTGATDSTINLAVFTLPANVAVRDCFIHISTIATTATLLQVGTSMTVSGFITLANGEVAGLRAIVEQDLSITATLGAGALVGPLLRESTTNSRLAKFYVRANATSGASIVWVNNTEVVNTAGEGYVYLSLERSPTLA